MYSLLAGDLLYTLWMMPALEFLILCGLPLLLVAALVALAMRLYNRLGYDYRVNQLPQTKIQPPITLAVSSPCYNGARDNTRKLS